MDYELSLIHISSLSSMDTTVISSFLPPKSSQTASAWVWIVQAGASIVAPYEVTHGSIKSIKINGKGNQAVTDISLGNLAITDETTVPRIASMVISAEVELSKNTAIIVEWSVLNSV